jgi:hypothetical protein
MNGQPGENQESLRQFGLSKLDHVYWNLPTDGWHAHVATAAWACGVGAGAGPLDMTHDKED